MDSILGVFVTMFPLRANYGLREGKCITYMLQVGCVWRLSGEVRLGGIERQ